MSKKIICVISDTHGLLRKEALEELSGADIIIHAGDIGNKQILDDLEKIAPVIAVMGNCDEGEWTKELVEERLLEIEGIKFYVLHDISKANINIDNSDINVVIYGHSHKPISINKDGILYVNPGSAGPRRFDLPTTIAKLEINNGLEKVEIVNLLI